MFEDTFMTARAFLGTVREAAQQAELLKRRINYHRELDEDTGHLEEELGSVEREKLYRARDVMEIISRLHKADQQTVMMKRYVDLESWEEIAADMDVGVREVQKLHGKALPVLDELLMGSGGGEDEVFSA